MNNIAKHSRATSAIISLHCQVDNVKLIIQDNGRGFDQSKIAHESLGINIMRERAETIGAKLDITSNPGRGVCVSVTWSANSQGKAN